MLYISVGSGRLIDSVEGSDGYLLLFAMEHQAVFRY